MKTNTRQNGGFDDTCQKVIMFLVAGLCCFGLLMIIILVPASLRNVKFDEYAIKYTRITRKVDDTNIYTEGKYVFAPSTKLFRYSRIVEKLEIVLPCLTNNGIVMNLQVDIQYQIRKSEVFTIFYTFGDPEIYEDFVELVASDAIRDVCGDYTAEQFYLNRTQIQKNINGTINAAFEVAEANLNIPVITLRSYSFPNVLDTAIKDKRYAENDIEIAKNERAGKLVEADSLLLQAQINADQLIIQATAEVDSILAEAYAEAEAITELWQERAQFYDDVRMSLNMTADEFVNQYLPSLVLQNAKTPITTID